MYTHNTARVTRMTHDW